MKVLFLFGGFARRMKASGTRQKLFIGDRRLWRVQSAIAEKAGFEPVFCTNELTKNGPRKTFPPLNTIGESVMAFLREEREPFAVIRGDILLHPSLWSAPTYVEMKTNKLGCHVIDGHLMTIGYNAGNYWSSFWKVEPKDYQIFAGPDWQLINSICDDRVMECHKVEKDSFVEIDSYKDVEKAECLLKNWNV